MTTDEELMIAIGRGDLRAFEELVARHQARAWSTAHRFLGDRSEAEDIAQEAFLRILDAAPRYRPESPFGAYFYRVVSRLCLDHLRKARPRLREEPPEVPSGTDPLEEMAADESRLEVRRALAALPENQRMAVILRYYEGLGHGEIAGAISTSEKAVERLLSRARIALAKSLASLAP